jgi:peptidoglycan/xylan/chitin deacetylase (PgdA/CDA1 family)
MDTTPPLLALKIDVDTFRGTRLGVANLARMLGAHRVNATFLLSLGPDHTGWALRRALRPGFFGKVARTSVIEHYGLKTLMYGTLLPGPDIGRRCAAALRGLRDAGFECGIHTWDHVLWQDKVVARDAAWTRNMMRKAAQRYVDVFVVAAGTHGAAGWQMNAAAFAEHDVAGYRYASDGRVALDARGALLDPASGPHRVVADGRLIGCVQLPTTLPTLDELLGRVIDGRTITVGNVAAHLLALTADSPRDHVYTLHAELEGQKLAPVFEQLLLGWRAQGYRLGTMADYYDKVKDAPLPTSPLGWGELPGRSGRVIMQGGAP